TAAATFSKNRGHIEPAHRQDQVSHALALDRHRLRPPSPNGPFSVDVSHGEWFRTRPGPALVMLWSACTKGVRRMTEAKLAPNLPGWMVDHANRYLSSGGTDGHMYEMTQPGRPKLTVPSLLLTTTGRKSGERFVFPLFYGSAD